MAGGALVTGAGQTAPVARDTKHLVQVLSGDMVGTSGLLPGRARTFARIMAGNLAGQAGIALLFHGTLLAWPFVALASLGVLATLSFSVGPLLAGRLRMWRASNRMRGMVEAAGPLVDAPTTDRPAVLVRTVFWEARPDGRATANRQQDVRGVPFLLRLPDGRAARIDPTTIFLLEQPHRLRDLSVRARQALGAPWRGRVRQAVHQSCIHPGDHLEVVGQLETEVDQTGEAAPARGVPLATFLRPLAGRLMWARRIQQDGDSAARPARSTDMQYR